MYRSDDHYGEFMDLYEHNTRSFIVKVWVEPRGDSTAEPLWRGHITQVYTSQRQYFEDLAVMVDFIRHSLEEIGVSNERINRSEPNMDTASDPGDI
jgi:hypothetical protein